MNLKNAFIKINKYLRKLYSDRYKFVSYIRNNKKLIKNFSIYLGGIILLKGIDFFLIPVYTRELTTESYGQLELLYTFINIISIIIGLGLCQYIGVHYFHFTGLDRKKEVISISLIYILIATPIIVASILFSNIISIYLFLSEIPIFLVIIALIIAYLIFFRAVYFSVLKQQQKALKLAITQGVAALISIGLNLYFIYYLKLGINGIIIAQLIVLILIIISIFLFNPIKIKIGWIKLNIKEIGFHLKISLPLVLASLTSWIMVVADRWILLIFRSTEEIGIYSLAYRFGSLFEILILMAISRAYNPYIFLKYQKNGILKTEKKNNIFIIYYLISSIFVCTIGFIILKPIFPIIVGEGFYQSYKYIILILFGYIFLGLSWFLGYSIYYLKKTNIILIGTAIGASINIILNFVLIPRFGVFGAAFTTTISYMLMSCYMFIIRKKILRAL